MASLALTPLLSSSTTPPFIKVRAKEKEEDNGRGRGFGGGG